MNIGPEPQPSTLTESDIRPMVGSSRRDPGPWIFGALAVLGAVMLFGALDAHRRSASAPATFVRSADQGPASSPPPLFIPPELPPPPPPPPPPELLISSAALGTGPLPPAQVTRPLVSPGYSPQLSQTSTASPPAPSIPEPPRRTGDVLVYDRARTNDGAPIVEPDADAGTGDMGQQPAADGTGAPRGRARAVRLGQLAVTVPQGALIPAVLETALDSTRPGFVRALVTQDVRGFDGSHVLIPRGSRLFGEYRADLAPGQNRAFVRWTRLVRPDGTALAVDSPAADSLGRAGVEGRVNSHFLERFGSAVLQSTVNIGVGLASRSIGDNSLIVALPGAGQSLAPGATASQIQPTLSVEAGTTVTVFVAHDLRLPAAESRR